MIIAVENAEVLVYTLGNIADSHAAPLCNAAHHTPSLSPLFPLHGTHPMLHSMTIPGRKVAHESAIAADCLRCGRGYEQTAYILTARRKQKGMNGEEAQVGAHAVRCRSCFTALLSTTVSGTFCK